MNEISKALAVLTVFIVVLVGVAMVGTVLFYMNGEDDE